jgi:hypothetical protein
MTHRFNRLLPRKTVLGTSLLAASFFVPAASLFTASAFAQVVNGTISGTVTDSTGAVIPTHRSL